MKNIQIVSDCVCYRLFIFDSLYKHPVYKESLRESTSSLTTCPFFTIFGNRPDGISNFSHNFCLLALLTTFLAKIWAAINLAQDHEWSIPMVSLLQHIQNFSPVACDRSSVRRDMRSQPKNWQFVRLYVDSLSGSSYEKSLQYATSCLIICHFIWCLQTSLLSLFLVQMG